MAILLKPGVVFLLLAILFMPLAASLSHHGGQYFLEPLRTADELSNRVERSMRFDYYSKVEELWSASWPRIIKLKHESGMEYGFQESPDRPYTLSKPCLDDVLRLAYGVSVIDGWALEMLDASGKLPSGVLLGNNQWLGMYGECVDISSKQSQAKELDNSTVLGQYCLINIENDTSASDLKESQIHLGICIPRKCNSTDAMALFNLVLMFVTDEFHATDADCSDNSALPLDSGAVAVIVILCVLGALVLLGTCLDVINNHWYQQAVVNEHTKDDIDETGESSLLLDRAQRLDQENFSVQRFQTDGCVYPFLIAFSALTNAKKILYVEPKQINRNLEALHGIRLLSMILIILHHTHFRAYKPTSNTRDTFEMFKRFSFQVIHNSSVAVDTFFLLSATLGSYLLLKEVLAKGGLRNINWLYFYFHRFWRLTPLYMIVLAIYATLFKYFGSGPYWSKESDEACKTSWWTNLLYINNIVHQDSMCLAWTWYLANDMQFFLLLPLFVALLYKWAVFGGIVIFVCMLVSSITTGVITRINNYPASFQGIWEKVFPGRHFLNDIYYVPWCRINPYLIGILLGYILYKSNCKLRIHRVLVVLGWCLAAVCSLSVVYGLYNVDKGHPLSPSINALYASVHRTAWSVGVAWVILACATGNGGFVNELLSLPKMQPLSRLTYAAYLVHPLVIIWYYESLKVPLFVDDIRMVYLFLGHLVLSFICGFVLSTLFEVPMINLERSFLRERIN